MWNLIKPSKETKQTHPLPPPIHHHANSHAPGAFFRKVSSVLRLQPHKDRVLKLHSEEKTMQSRIKRGCFGCMCCCGCMCTSICVLILILVAIGCIFYFGFSPKAPNYSLNDLSVFGFEPLLISPNTPINPSIVATIQTENPNKWISFFYQPGGLVSVGFGRANLCEGDWPMFGQRPKNLTVFQTNLTGSGVMLTVSNRDELIKYQLNGSVPLTVNAEVLVKIKFSFVKSSLIKVDVMCNVSVSGFTAKAAILSKVCGIKTQYLW